MYNETQMANWVVVFVLVLIWSLVWKYWALWRAARNTHRTWFIVMAVLNTAGILEIVYIFAFSGYGDKKKKLEKAD
jgi:hypothetical protein